MTTHRLCLSDLHLGDGRSVLSDPAVARLVAADLSRIVSSGTLDTLVLCGDVWEECVPARLGEPLAGGYNPAVLADSSRFFTELMSWLHVREVVWVPGNHDLCLWHDFTARHNSSYTQLTGVSGVVLEDSDFDFFRPLFGTCWPATFRVAYPVYCPTDDYPALIFTHGHLLDPLVRGLAPEATYAALRALGCARPSVPADASELGSARDLALRTDPFTLGLWSRYSSRDYTYANAVMRRLEHPESCPSYDDRASFMSLALLDRAEPSTSGSSLDSQAQWFLDLCLTDPRLPTPVGELSRGPGEHASTLTAKSCLVHGHDHLGTRRVVSSGGVPFEVVDTGGWTSEWQGHRPHTHVLAWDDVSTVVPTSYWLRGAK